MLAAPDQQISFTDPDSRSMATSGRGSGMVGHKITSETRFYITSLVMLAAAVGPMIRSHWAIENSLRWVMDMVFRDEECRVRTDNAPANFATCRHFAYNLTRKAPGKDSIHLRRITAGVRRRISRQPRRRLISFTRFPCI